MLLICAAHVAAAPCRYVIDFIVVVTPAYLPMPPDAVAYDADAYAILYTYDADAD